MTRLSAVRTSTSSVRTVLVSARPEEARRAVPKRGKRLPAIDCSLSRHLMQKARGGTSAGCRMRPPRRKTRPDHDAIDGTIVPIDDDFSVGGERLFLPSDPSASLTQTANCRCTVEFVSQTENGTSLSAHGEGRDTIIVYEDGTEEVRSGGTRSWRNNNPGNLRNSPFSIRHGSLGEAGGFAVFPSEDAGWRALLSLLRGSTFQALTLDRMIARYAPPNENDTHAYRDFIGNRLGVSEETRLSELSSSQIEELASLIRRFEGWSVGTVRRRKGE